MGWRAVGTKDNWATISTYAGDALMRNTRKPVRLLWPDGTESTQDLLWRLISRLYMDHGHRAVASSEIPYIRVVFRGSDFPVDLINTGCKVWIDG